MQFRKIIPVLCFMMLLGAQAADGEFILGDGSGGGGGGGRSDNGGGGGAGGGSNDTLNGTAGNDIIFGDGSGGGGGGRGSFASDGAGGAGGGGADTINGGEGNDIIFGDGFNGANAGFNPGPGGLGGGGGGGGGGGFAGGPGGATGGLGAGAGAGGTNGGGAGQPVFAGFGNAGGGAGGSGGASILPTTGGTVGNGGGGNNAGGGGGGFGGANGGGGGNFSPGGGGGSGNTITHTYSDTGGGIYTFVSGQLATVFTSLAGTAAGTGAGRDILNGGTGSDNLFGLGGNDLFDFELNDAGAADVDTIWDFKRNGDLDGLRLFIGGVQLQESDITTLLQNQVTSGNDRSLIFTDSATHQVTIVVKNIGRDLVRGDFNYITPTGGDATSSATEDTNYVFSTSDFTFADLDTNVFGGITVVTTTTGLRLNGTPVANGTAITHTQIAANQLVYAPTANQNGSPLATFTLQVTDGIFTSSATYTQSINVAPVSDPPGVPTDSNSAANTVAENAANGTTVGVTASSTDPDAGAVLTYSLTNNAGGRFAINAGTGVVSVANGTLLNFEAATSHMITVQVSDGTLTATQSFTIAVTNANETPSAPADTDAVANSVAENAANGTLARITAFATDPDAGAVLTYSLSNSAGGRFAINATTGVVSLANGSLLDFEAATSHTITVQVSDGSLTATHDFTVGVTNVNEGVFLDSLSASTLTPASGQTVTFTVAASDLDGTTPSLSIDYGDGSTGTSLTHAYASNGQYTVVVTATDGEFSAQKSLVLNVQPADFNDDGFVGPMDKDSDGDGVPDVMEIALGTSPTNAADSPLDANNTEKIRFRMDKQKAAFGKAVGDEIKFNGVLHVPAGLNPVGESLAIDAGGNVRAFELDAMRRFESDEISFRLNTKLNSKRAKEATFKLTIRGELLANMISNSPKDEQDRPTQLTAHILFNGQLLVQTKGLRYRK